ncbi:MAG: discoidin domain-containing protein, partial [Acidobacteriota bacterium]|nr:discoidin domain-containing protein [Acidobacteriota bacterium]
MGVNAPLRSRGGLVWWEVFLVATLAGAPPAHVITVDLSHPLNVVNPALAIGAGIDGHEKGEVERLLSPANIAAMRSAGLRPLTYRLRTELAGEVWHWNPKGTWSDAARQQGYWISDATPGDPIEVSYGYRLPRRGNTVDQANNDGYSRIDDGRLDTFWKSNPYLDPAPQWVVIDLKKKVAVNTLRVQWGVPWAVAYKVQYATRDDIDAASPDIWRDFPQGSQRAENGGQVTTRFASAPISARKIRVFMTAASGTAPAGATDARDRLGFAIEEIWLGTTSSSGHFTDVVRHAPQRERQSEIWVSSTDPWHSAGDCDEKVEQPGFDRMFHDGLTNDLPMLTPVGVLYDTPENAVAEIRYLKARGFPVEEIELGEEPEEQQVPADYYGALYIKWAAALHALDPRLRLGGPSLVLLAPEGDAPATEASWTKRLTAYFREQNALNLLQFFSFEWYPFDEVCKPVAPQLVKARELLTRSLERLAKDGVPRNIPWFMTEYGYSAYGSAAEVDLPGAILNADTVGTFLAFGGAKAFLYGYEPGELLHERPCTWGNHMLFLSGPPLHNMPTYYGAQ